MVSKVSNNRNGRSNVVATEWGMAISIDNGPECQIITAQPEQFTYNELLTAAKIDVLSFLCLYHNGIEQNSTYAWLPTHAIEKQIKGYLLKSGKYERKKLFGFRHGVKELWDEYKKTYSFESNEVIEEFINEISEISTHVRYGEMIVGVNDNLVSGLIYVHTLLMFQNESDFKSKLYGWTENEIRFENPMTFNVFGEIFKAYLHLIIEHRLVISPAGMCHPHKYVEIDEFKLNIKDVDCPLCRGLIQFNLAELGLTSPFKCKVIAEYLKNRMFKALSSSFYLKHPESAFSKEKMGFEIARGKNIGVNLGKSKK